MSNRRDGMVAGFLRCAASALFLLSMLPAAASGADEEGCLFCHRHPLVSAVGGVARSLKVSDPQDAFHSPLYCSDCHGDAKTAPHPARPVASSCIASCHASATTPDSHKRASWGGLTEEHRSISQPRPPCLLCHGGGDRRGDRLAPAAHCAGCHPRHSATIRSGVHSYFALSGSDGPCSSCHPAHTPASAAAGADNARSTIETRCSAAGCHGQVTAVMKVLGGHRAASPPSRVSGLALLALACLAGLLPGVLFRPSPDRSPGVGEMKWITAPARVTRYTLAQRLQHLGGTILFAVLLASALARALGGGLSSHRTHVLAGEGAALLLLLHLGYIIVTAVRLDLPLSEVAFLPVTESEDDKGKYSRSERADYLFLLLFALSLCATGLVLRWPGTLGLSPGGYGLTRTVHLFFASAATVHLMGTHGRLRLLSGAPGFSSSIVTGTVPLSAAEGRPGWIRRLVASGVLIPVPEEKKSEETRESALVRDLLEEGNRLVRCADYDGARRKYSEALHHYPDYAQARFNLAIACMKGGETSEAERHFTSFLEADPFNPMADKAREYLESCREGRKP